MKITMHDVSKIVINKKQKEAVYVLYHVNVEFLDQAINVVLGKSGAGKTFLLKVLAGLEAVDDGQIFFDDEDVTLTSSAKRNLSYLSQNYALYPHLTIFDNVAYPLKLQGIESDEIRSRTDKILKDLKIDHLKTRKPKELSGGELQRAAIARAIIKRPNLLLLDEPLSNIDKALRDEFLDLIKKIHEKYLMTIVYVTHNLNEAYRMSDQVIIIDNGTIKETGLINDLYHDQNSFFYQNFVNVEEK